MCRLLPIILLAAVTTAFSSEWDVPCFDLRPYSIIGDTVRATYDREHGKLYLGYGSYDNKALAVFDIDDDGHVLGSPRRYPVHPDYMPPDDVCYVKCMLLDKAHSKLFMGLSFSSHDYPECLSMYALDADGEPSGPVRVFATGNPYGDVQGMALHPTLDRLYTVGWGGPAVYALDLDADGTPTGAKEAFAVLPYGKFSVAVRPDGTRLYLGTYPYVLEVCTLDASGDVTGGHSDYPIPGGPGAYLEMVANDRGVYFPLDDKLAYFQLDDVGDPTGSPIAVSNLTVQAVAMSATGSLVLAESATYSDAVSGELVHDGFRVRERAVGADATPAAVLRESEVFQRLTAAGLGAIPNAIVPVRNVSRFQGNRFAGLSIRFSVDSLVPDGPGAVKIESTKLSTKSKYLYFAYSTNHHAVYATGTDVLLTHFLEETGIVTSVTCVDAGDAVAVDDALGVLYVGLTDGSVEVRTLDADGIPASNGETIATDISPIRKLCVNPQSHHVYVCGHGSTAGPLPDPSTPAAERLVQVPGSTWFSDAVADPDRDRLYGCRKYNAHDNIMVWRLNPDGTLLDTSPTYYSDGIPATTNDYRGLVLGVKLDADKQRIYFAGNRELSQDFGAIIVYALDENGDLAGTPTLYPSPNVKGTAHDIAISTNGHWLYDVGWGDHRLHGRPLDASGDPTGETTSWSIGGYGKMDLAFTEDGSRLMMGTYPSTLEVIPVLPDGRPLEGYPATFSINSLSTNLEFFAVGYTSVWVNLNQALSNNLGAVMGTLTFSGGAASGAVLTVEMALANGTNLVSLTNLSYTVAGNKAYLFFPGYDTDDPSSSGIAAQVETEAMRYERYLAWAQKYALPAGDRPRMFMISTGLIGKNSGFAELERGVETLAALGHNTLQIWNFAGQVPPETIYTTATNHGIDRFRFATYKPPSYFDYDTNLVDASHLDTWADGFTNNVAAMGVSLDELRLFKLADEPGWYYPGVIEAVTSSPGALAVFQEYLQSNAASPQFLGYTNWADILPIGLSRAVDLPSRRLLYSTARFYAESASRGFAAATSALRRRLNTNMYIAVNFNNWPGRYFKPSPDHKIGNNPVIGPDSAMGGPDWFDFGRKQSVTAQWTEDWFGDWDAQFWSFRAELLRCSGQDRDMGSGAYVIGRTTGAMPEGGMYKIMSLAGHGAKIIDTYTFGPEHSFPGNCWSEREATYESLAGGLKLLGRCEDVAFPGTPAPASVAILLPQASQVWDPDYRMRLYLYELYGIHCALMHEQYPVDFIDDFGIEEGVLDSRDYAVLYVTAPNLSSNAQYAVHDWVDTGGTLVMMPGACLADEYDEPLSVLADDMAASWGSVPRLEPPGVRDLISGVISVSDTRLGATGDVTRAQTAPLTLSGATSLADLADGGTAVSEATMGSGRIIAYGYWPGTTYYTARDTFEKYRLPKGWNRNTRKILTAPARIAHAAKHIEVSEEIVEASVLESDAGTAVVLLNWTGEPIPQLTVRVPLTPQLRTAFQSHQLHVSAALAGGTPYFTSGDSLTAYLPLDSVDVLMLEIQDQETRRPTMLFIR